MTLTEAEYLHLGSPEAGGTRRIAYRRRLGAGPGIVWLGGLRSDMLATKASALDAWAAANGHAFVRFDYSGHGESDGSFEDGTIGRWLEDAEAVLQRLTEGPQILVGSSLGGWLALLLARRAAAAGRALAGLVLLAPAVDFTERLMWAGMTADERATIEREGRLLRPSAYGDPLPITRALIEEGRRHLLMDGLIRSHAPVHIVQGMADPDVPWRHAMALMERLADDAAVTTLIKDGDHRLSRPQDLERLIAAVTAMLPPEQEPASLARGPSPEASSVSAGPAAAAGAPSQAGQEKASLPEPSAPSS